MVLRVVPPEFFNSSVATDFNSADPMASFAILFSATVSKPIIAPVTVLESPVVTTLPVTSGKFIVLSAVGSVTSIVVSKLSAVPSTKARSTVH